MSPALGFDDLMEYTAWQRARWRAWFDRHPDALAISAGPHGDGRFTTVGDLVKHIFGAETRYVQRLTGQPLSDMNDVPSSDVGALFDVGDKGRRELKRFIDDLPQQQWDTPRELKIMSFLVTASPKKIVMHTLMHEIRHWAQLATICRMNGVAGEFHDFLASPIWGGEFRPA
jgi:uncharacterized damage-inducible protein DinB